MAAIRTTALAVLGLLALAPMQAKATTADTTTVFDFAGVCTDCTGIGTGQLTLSKYTPGQQISSTNFVSFHYDGSDLIGAFTIANAEGSAHSGGAMVAPFPSANEGVNFSDNSYYFYSDSTGWGLGTGSMLLDYGPTYTWSLAAATAVPEPAAAALLLAGLAGAGFGRRRRAA